VRKALQFGPFQFDLQTRELRNRGLRVKLRPQSIEVLAALAERPGELVTREELRERLWPGALYGDFDNGLNSAVNRLREALGDQSGEPRYIETVARRGYRFVHEVARTQLGPPQPLRLVVLPFDNLSGDPDEEYFCEGLAGELTYAFTHLPGLHVIARSSALALKGHALDVREIGRRLGVSAVVEGAVQRSANRLRVTVSLIDAADGAHLWSGRFDRESSDVFTVQDETANAVVGALRLTLLEGETARLVKRHTENMVAFDHYLKGRWLWGQRTPQAVARAKACFEEALQAEPKSACAHAAVSECYCTSGFLGYLPPGMAFPKAKDEARRALDLDPQLGEAHGALGWVLWAFDWDWEKAEESFLRAEELRPGYAQTRLWHAFLLASQSRFEEAIDQIEQAWQLDPLSLVMQCNVAAILHLARRHEAAIERCLRALEMDPDFGLGNFHLGRSYLALGQHQKAIAPLEKAAPGFPMAIGGLGAAWAKMGRRDKALEILHELECLSSDQYVGAIPRFAIYSGLEERDRAIEQLALAFDAHEGVVPILAVDPLVDSVRNDSRVKALLRRLKLPRRTRAGVGVNRY